MVKFGITSKGLSWDCTKEWADKRVCTQGKGSQLYFVLAKLLNVKMTHIQMFCGSRKCAT